MFNSEDLANWLTISPITFPVVVGGSASEAISVVPGPYLNIMPDRLVTATVSGGSGTSGEEQYDDRPTFQIRSRGAQGAEPDAEQIAWAVDIFLRRIQGPVWTPAGTLIKAVTRTGGQPTPLGQPDEAMRYTFTCNYIAIVGVNFGQ